MSGPYDQLLVRLRAIVSYRQGLAIEASINSRGSTPTGEHWRWQCASCDLLVDWGPDQEFLECRACGCVGVDIRSVEQYPDDTGPLPHFVTNSAEEIRPIDAILLLTNEPAAVLRHCARDLKVLERHSPVYSLITGFETPECRTCCAGGDEYLPWPCPEIRDLAEALNVPLSLDGVPDGH